MFRFVAQLLHPSIRVDASCFPAPQIFWDRLVQLGSSQLVLPAIYSALERKKLINYAPKDLVSYLKEITDLNHERNTAILCQIDFLSKVFKKNNVDHVFLKGAAMLIAKPYSAKNDRMVGDIDILVSYKDLLRAQDILINEGFGLVSNKFSFSKDAKYKDLDKHLERIAHPNYIAAVELHRFLLDKKNYLILSNDVLKNKVMSKGGQWIPSKEHLWQHSILNWQYNDSGLFLNFLAFRPILDVLYIEPKDLTIKLKNATNAIKHFYSLLSIFYDNYKIYYPLKNLLYKFQLQSRIYFNLQLYIKNIISFIIFCLLRFNLFLKSKTYRQRIIGNKSLFIHTILDLLNKKLRRK
jgi:hypothetical protein